MTKPKDIRRELDTLKAQQVLINRMLYVFLGSMSVVALGVVSDWLSESPPGTGITGTLLPYAVFTLMLWLMGLSSSTKKIVDAIYMIHEQTEDIV